MLFSSLRSRRRPCQRDRLLAAVQDALVAEDAPAEYAYLAERMAEAGPEAHRPALITLASAALAHAHALRCSLPRARAFARAVQTKLESFDLVGAVETLLHNPDLARPMTGRSAEASPLIIDGFVQLRRFETLQEAFIDELFRISEVDTSLPFTGCSLSPEQNEAVRLALQSSVTVISGGPGTGKTSTVVALLAAAQAAGIEDVVLTAPTGKAAFRMAESIRASGSEPPPAQTLHRLLGARPGQTQMAFHRSQPLPYRLVVVDEASMLGLELATYLLQAIASGSKLILLGDVDQLPSVETGSILRALVTWGKEESAPISLARLTTVFRVRKGDEEGQRVLQLAQAILRRDEAAATKALGQNATWLETNEQIDAWLVEQFEKGPLFQADFRRAIQQVRLIENGDFVDPDEVTTILRQSQRRPFLTAHRQDGFLDGSERINRLLHRVYAQRWGRGKETSFLPGEPVMVLHNDYGRSLFNGDVGIILRCANRKPGRTSEAARSMAVFLTAHGPRAFELESLERTLSLAHAITVHKAQGSEYQAVNILLPEPQHAFAPSLYTAVTRAKSQVQLAGFRQSFACAFTASSQDSNVALVERLRNRA